MVIQKTQDLLLILNLLKKFQKNSREKSCQQKNRVFDFCYCLQKFSAFYELFCIFSTDSNSASNFAFYDTHCEFFLSKKLFLA
jgi:hypothetical protein